MKAALLEAPGKPFSVVDDVAIGEPGPGQVRVRVSHCGVCHSDLSIADGVFPSPTPVVLGHEAAGVVEAVGASVENVAVGDSVVLSPCPPCGRCYWCVRDEASLCVESLGIQTNALPDGSTGLSRGGDVVWRGVNLGGFAESVIVHQNGAVKIPDDVPREVACVVGCAVQTGVGAALNTAGVSEGATVLVMGLGGVGLSTVQGAVLAGAARIIVSDPVAERREAARTFGATDLLDPANDDVVTAARELTNGIGVDYAFETAGVTALIDTGLAATRNGGTLTCVGAPPLQDPLTVVPAAFVITGKKILGTVLGGVNSLRDIPRFIDLWRAGRLDLEGLITARRPLAEINEAFEDLRASRGIRTVLEI